MFHDNKYRANKFKSFDQFIFWHQTANEHDSSPYGNTYYALEF